MLNEVEQLNIAALPVWSPQPSVWELREKNGIFYRPDGLPYDTSEGPVIFIPGSGKHICLRPEIPSPQEILLKCPYKLVGFGGARGGGKVMAY